METFQRLAERVEGSWSAVSFDPGSFAAIAHEALREWLEDDALPTRDALLRSAATAPRLAPQLSLGSGFGEPPLTLAVRDRFYVEALFWLDGTTTIHEHAFSGAFTLLSGSSLHARYGFEPAALRTDEMRLGRLTFEGAEVLRRGDVRAIAPGAELIHALFHLARPSVSLVVRTYGVPALWPQLDYRPCLAVSHEPRTPGEQRRLAVLDLMCRMQHKHAADVAGEALARADLRFAHDLILATATLSHGPALLPPLLAAARGRFAAAWVDAIEDAWRHERRVANIASRRRTVTEPGQRLFLAVLLNVPTRDGILGCVSDLVPDSDPVETVLGWMSALAATPSPNRAELGPNLLGVELPDGWREVADGMLRGREAETGLGALKARMILEHSQLLAPLFGA